MVLLFTLLVACGDRNQSTEPDAPTSDSDSTTETGTATGPDELPSCTEYCTGMKEVCAAEAFPRDAACLTWCNSATAPVPVGELTDTAVDTLGCRMNHLAQAAATGANAIRAEHCANASASGGDTCGSWCDVYCRQGVATCSAANEAYPPDRDTYFDEDPEVDPHALCEAACPDFSTEVLDGVSQVDQHFGYGDTVQCRLHHQQGAMIEGETGNRNAYALHCGHAAIEPTELCTNDARPNTVNYCEFALDFCPDLFPSGTDALACRGTLNALVEAGQYDDAPFLSFTDTDRNSLGCLNYWIMAAPLDPAACAKADWDPEHWSTAGGAGVCVPPP